jgi:hypothetical protein
MQEEKKALICFRKDKPGEGKNVKEKHNWVSATMRTLKLRTAENQTSSSS